MGGKKILIVDDDVKILRTLETMLSVEDKGYAIVTAPRGEEALKTLESGGFKLVLTDMRMPGMDGIQLLQAMRQRSILIPVIILTAHGTIQNVVEAMKAGAHDYLTKPPSMEELTIRVSRALEWWGMKEEIKGLKEAAGKRIRKSDYIIGTSDRIKSVLQQITMVARSDVTVLIRGPSGTGKELVARAIHRESKRSSQQLVVVNCSALPESLLENELFGHERGAYTGAHADQKGLFEVAHNGTIFLDEIGDIPPSIQVKLLRVLQYGEIKKIGGTKTINVDVRVIAATNRDLEKAVSDGSFREDIFYRLNVIPIYLPALKDRREDIPMLAHHFLAMYCRKFEKEIEGYSPDAMQKMVDYDWPGNVRELENKTQRTVLMCQGKWITAQELFTDEEETLNTARSFKDLKKEVVEEFERDYVQQMLKLHKGNISRAALQGKLNRKNFWALMKKYGIDSKSLKE